MFNVLKVVTKFIFVLIFLSSCRQAAVTTSLLGDKEELVVAMDMDMPGYFSLEGEDFGFQYDLLKTYADDAGLALRIIPGRTKGELAKMYEDGTADIIMSPEPPVNNPELSLGLFTTSYVAVTNGRDAAEYRQFDTYPLHTALSGKRVVISSGFKATASWNTLLDSLTTSATYVSSRGGVELIELLRENRFDYVICEKSEARIGCALVSGVREVHSFPDLTEVAITVSDKIEGLYEDLSLWLDGYRSGNHYNLLASLYFEDERPLGIAGKRIHRQVKGISEYDYVMRKVCEREGYDWRLLSAIAYNESRFNADIVSHRGATGLMQIMPSTARQFDVDPEHLRDPEVNIMLAAKLLDKIESMLRLPRNITYTDKMSIILACYNCGIGHVLDARRLAAKYGESPNSWPIVSKYLSLKSTPEYLADDAVRCGQFRGSGQTRAFVNNVMGRYNTYCDTYAM